MTTRLPYAPPDSVAIPSLDPFFGPDAPLLLAYQEKARQLREWSR